MKKECQIFCRTANKIPIQNNSTDCGIFICQYAECVALNMETMDFEHNNIKDIRNQMKIELAFGELDKQKHEDRKKV